MSSIRNLAFHALVLFGSAAFAGTIHHDFTNQPITQVPILKVDGLEIVASQSAAASLVTTGGSGLGVNTLPANSLAIQPAESLNIRFTKGGVENLKIRLVGSATGANVRIRTRDGWADTTNSVQVGALFSVTAFGGGSKEIEEIQIGTFNATVTLAELDASFREFVPGQDLKMFVDPSTTLTKPLRTRLFAVEGMKLVFEETGPIPPKVVVNSSEYETRNLHTTTLVDTAGKHTLEFNRSGFFDLEFMTSSTFVQQSLTLSTSVDFKRKFDETNHEVRHRAGKPFGEFIVPALANMQVAFTLRGDPNSSATLGAELVAPDGTQLPLTVTPTLSGKGLSIAPVLLPTAGFYSLRITGMELDDVVDLRIDRTAPPAATGEVTPTP